MKKRTKLKPNNTKPNNLKSLKKDYNPNKHNIKYNVKKQFLR